MVIKTGAQPGFASATQQVAKSTRLLLIAEDSSELAVLRTAFASERVHVQAAEVEKLEWVCGKAFDVASIRANAPSPLWQEVTSLIKSRWGIPVLCMLPIPEPEQVPLLARLCADAFAFLPVRPEEVIARIELLAWKAKEDTKQDYPFKERRRAVRHSLMRPAEESVPPEAERLVVDDREKKVMLGGQAIHLSPLQYRLLLLLASDPGRVFSVSEICAHLWPRKRVQNTDVQQHIYLLRHKIEKDAANPTWIQTEPGFGYKLSRPEHP